MHPSFALSLLLAVSAAVLPVQAGEAVVARQEFKQSATYPYVFRPVCYLAAQGPVPLRFASSGPLCSDRKPPKLPVVAKPELKAESAALPPPASAEPPPLSTATPPAFPPPANAPAPKSPAVDFSQFPAELVETFRKQREAGDNRNYLFDPIFQPALPENDLPKSKATYEQK